MRAFDMFEFALFLLLCVMMVAFLGYALVHAGKRSSEFRTKCHGQGGAVIEGYRGPDLCVRDGLIIMPKGE